MMKSWLKRVAPSAYYWTLLVIWPSLVAALTSQESRKRFRDSLVSIAISLVIAILAVIGLGTVGILQNVGRNLNSVLLVLGAYLVLRFLANLVYFPPRLYFEAMEYQDRTTWQRIRVDAQEIREKHTLLGYGVGLRNDKLIYLNTVVIQMPYFEVDDIPYRQGAAFGQRLDSEIRRLSWVGEANPLQPTERYVSANGGKAIAYLVHITLKDSHPKEVRLRYCERSAKSGHFEETSIVVDRKAAGELVLHAAIGMAAPLPNGLESRYNFALSVDANKNVTFRLRHGGLSAYTPPAAA